MLRTIQRLAGLGGFLFLLLALVAGLAGADDLGWLLVAVSAFLFTLSLFTGSRATLHDR